MHVNVSNFYQSDNLIELNVNKADYTLKKLKLNVESLEENVLKPLKFIDIYILQIQYFKDNLFMKASSNDTRYIKFCSTTKMITKIFCLNNNSYSENNILFLSYQQGVFVVFFQWENSQYL